MCKYQHVIHLFSPLHRRHHRHHTITVTIMIITLVTLTTFFTLITVITLTITGITNFTNSITTPSHHNDHTTPHHTTTARDRQRFERYPTRIRFMVDEIVLRRNGRWKEAGWKEEKSREELRY